MLSASQVEQYREEGYVVPDFRLPDKTVDAIRVHHELFLENHPEFVDYCPALLIHDTGFLNYARNDEILDMVEQLIGPNIALWNAVRKYILYYGMDRDYFSNQQHAIITSILVIPIM